VSLRGQLLVGSPRLHDPNFRRSVILVAAHGNDGALGVVLNRPSSIAVAEAAPVLADLVEEGDVVYAGGPVQPSAVLVVVEVDDRDVLAESIVGDVGLMRDDAEVADVADVARRVRVFAGYAGWGAGQLEAELESLDWIVEDAEPDDVFAPADADLWASVLRRKGREFRLVATMPLDPGLN
jgi:putative transcriptional regulator